MPPIVKGPLKTRIHEGPFQQNELFLQFATLQDNISRLAINLRDSGKSTY
jgi:hypothetical protein